MQKHKLRTGTSLAFATLAAYCRQRDYPEPVAEHPFAKPRRYAFDLAWPDRKLALEIEGGFFGKGKPCPLCKRRPVAGHGSIERTLTDMAKYNLAARLGWSVLRCRPDEVDSGAAFKLLDLVFGLTHANPTPAAGRAPDPEERRDATGKDHA